VTINFKMCHCMCFFCFCQRHSC